MKRYTPVFTDARLLRKKDVSFILHRVILVPYHASTTENKLVCNEIDFCSIFVAICLVRSEFSRILTVIVLISSAGQRVSFIYLYGLQI